MNDITMSKDDTRNRLLMTAMKLYAENGVDAVSMRTINTEAGTKNASAAHYHFGSKAGMLEKIITYINNYISDKQNEALNQLEQAEHSPSVEEVLRGSLLPYVQLCLEPNFGQYAAKLLSRLLIETNTDIQNLLNQHSMPYLKRIDALLAQALPSKPAKERQMHFLFVLAGVIHGVADIDLIKNSPFGDLQDKSIFETAERFLTFYCAGMSS